MNLKIFLWHKAADSVLRKYINNVSLLSHPVTVQVYLQYPPLIFFYLYSIPCFVLPPLNGAGGIYKMGWRQSKEGGSLS